MASVHYSNTHGNISDTRTVKSAGLQSRSTRTLYRAPGLRPKTTFPLKNAQPRSGPLWLSANLQSDEQTSASDALVLGELIVVVWRNNALIGLMIFNHDELRSV